MFRSASLAFYYCHLKTMACPDNRLGGLLATGHAHQTQQA